MNMIFSLGALLICIIIVILIAVVVKSETSKKGGENVIKTVYIYLILFATLMMTIGGSVAAFMATADIIAPAPYYETFEEFRLRESDKKEAGEATEKMSEEQSKERYENMVKSHKQNQIDRAKNSLVKSFGWIIIPLPVFIGVTRRLKKNEE